MAVTIVVIKKIRLTVSPIYAVVEWPMEMTGVICRDVAPRATDGFGCDVTFLRLPKIAVLRSLLVLPCMKHQPGFATADHEDS
jgi:hypothetical protein